MQLLHAGDKGANDNRVRLTRFTALLRGQFPSAEQGAPLVLLTRQNMNQPDTPTP